MAQNLLTYSEAFDNWTKTRCTVGTNVTTAPDGSATGGSIIEDGTAGNSHYVMLAPSSPVVGRMYTFSCYVKAGSRNIVQLGGNSSITASYATFNLLTEVATTSTAAGGGMESAGNGWYRCWVNFVYTANNCQIIPSTGSILFDGMLGQTALYIWGAQVTETNGPASYVKTTGTAINGRVPRGQMPKQNLDTYSENLSSWRASTSGMTVSSDADVAPDGTTTADRLYCDSSNTVHYVRNSVTLIVGRRYTYSVYAKAGTATTFAIGTGVVTAAFDLSAGTLTSGTGYIEPVGNGWYRCAITFTATITSGAKYLYMPFTATYQGTSTEYILIWGNQTTETECFAPYAATSTPAINQGAPRGQMPRQNLIAYSQGAFENAWWSETALTASDVNDLAPDGTMTASRLIENSASSSRYLAPASQVPGYTIGQTLCISYYAKTVGETRGTALTNGTSSAYFDLVNGLVLQATSCTAGIEPAGNGWYRCWVAYAGTANRPTIYMTTGSTTASYQGDGATYINLWGAQLTLGERPAPYVATSGTAINQGTPRGQLPKQNLVPQSNTLSVSWGSTNVTYDIDGVGPVGTAWKVTDDSTLGAHRIYVTPVAGTFVVGRTYTVSVFAKAGTRNYVALSVNNGSAVAYFNIATGALASTSAGTTSRIEPIGDGWYRCSITYLETSGISYSVIVYMSADGTTGTYTGDGSFLYVSGLQLSRSAGPAQYVETTSTIIDQGTPRGQLPKQNLLKYSNDLTQTGVWTVTSGNAVVDNGDGSFTISDSSAAAYGLVTQSITTGTPGRRYHLSFYVKKTSGGTAYTFGVNWLYTTTPSAICVIRVNTDSGYVTDTAGGVEWVTSRDEGDYWRIDATAVAQTSTLSLGVYPTVGDVPASATSVGATNVARTGTAIVKWFSLTEAASDAEYVATGSTAINQGAPRGLQ